MITIQYKSVMQVMQSKCDKQNNITPKADYTLKCICVFLEDQGVIDIRPTSSHYQTRYQHLGSPLGSSFSLIVTFVIKFVLLP